MFIIDSQAKLLLAIRTELDKIYSFTMGIISDEEIDFYVPKAMARWVKQKALTYEDNVKSARELQLLTRQATLMHVADDDWKTRIKDGGASYTVTSRYDYYSGICNAGYEIWFTNFLLPSNHMYSMSEVVRTKAQSNYTTEGYYSDSKLRSVIRKDQNNYVGELTNPLSTMIPHRGKSSILRVEFKGIIRYYYTRLPGSGSTLTCPTDLVLMYFIDPFVTLNPNAVSSGTGTDESKGWAYATVAPSSTGTPPGVGGMTSFAVLQKYFPYIVWDEIISLTINMLLEAMQDPRAESYAAIANTAA